MRYGWRSRAHDHLSMRTRLGPRSEVRYDARRDAGTRSDSAARRMQDSYVPAPKELVTVIGSAPRGLPVAAVAAAVAFTACTNTPVTSTTSPSADGTGSPGHTAPAASFAPDDQAATSDEIAGLWEAVHDERLEQSHADTPPDASAFSGITTDRGTEALLDLIRAARSDVPTEVSDTELWPQVEIAAGGDRATIEDCVIVATRPGGDEEARATVRSQVWTGAAIATEDGWRIDTISPGQDHCVPTELHEQLLDAYAAYHRAWTAAWDPPNPDHPLLAETMTGQRLEEIRQQLEADRDDGIAFRDPHDPLENAVVFELGIGTATVSDCHRARPDYGAFDVDTGERRDDVVPPVEPGQLNLTSVELVRADDGDWKVVEAGGLDDTNCEPGGTDYVVAP